MGNLNEMLSSAWITKRLAANLKIDSPYYPEILKAKDGNATFYSTLVRIERDGVWYTVHHVESMIDNDEKCLLRLIDNVHKTQYLYVINGGITKLDGSPLQDVDTLQQSEKDRLIGMLKL